MSSAPVAPPETDKPAQPALERGLGVVQAAALNIANMVGVGPFITIPLFLAAMGGPGGMGGVAGGAAVGVMLLLCGRVRVVGWLAVGMCAGTLVTVFAVIFAGVTHFNPSLLRVPPGAFRVNWAWIIGLGGAMRIAV